MQSNDFEKAYSDFIDGREYDEAQDLLFSMVRSSFTAGWQAAGGAPPTPHKIFEVLSQKEQEDENVCYNNGIQPGYSKKGFTRWMKKKDFRLLMVYSSIQP